MMERSVDEALHALWQPAFPPDVQSGPDAKPIGGAVLVRYVSFQKGMHRAPEFLAFSRWGQVPVLLDGDRTYLQSAAIVEHLADALGHFQGSHPAARQAVREWLDWDVDALFPPVFGCYGVQLGQRKLLPLASSRRLLNTTVGAPGQRCRAGLSPRS